MGNKLLAKACETVQAHRGMTSLDEFWRKFGRPDLIAFGPTGEAPVLLEIQHVAERVFARRIKAESGTEIDLGDGRKGKIVRAEKPKNPPLREFIHENYYYALRPTKGWRKMAVDRFEIEEYKRRGVADRVNWPKRLNKIAA